MYCFKHIVESVASSILCMYEIALHAIILFRVIPEVMISLILSISLIMLYEPIFECISTRFEILTY